MSVALVVIKIIVGVFSATALWASGRYLLYRAPAATRAPPLTVSKMLRWKMPPWLQSEGRIPRDGPSWIIGLVTLALFIQPFTSPLLTGSVNWNVGLQISSTAMTVSSVDPAADFGIWWWYHAQGAFDKRRYFRSAAGYANLAWAEATTVDAHGTSISGNGCRHVVNNDGLPPGSVLVDAILPCINIHSIRWCHSGSEVPAGYWAGVNGKSLSLLNEDPFSFYIAGTTFAFAVNETRQTPTDKSVPPPSSMFSGTMAILLLLERKEGKDDTCKVLSNTIFGNIDETPYLRQAGNLSYSNCYLIGQINFTAGVTRSSRATYLSQRVVEDQTPIEDVQFEPNPWVRESLWWLPDLMSILAQTNASQLPTFNNIDAYAGGLVRQAYLAAWDSLSRGFDETGPSYSAFAYEPRLVAKVSFARVFPWMALCLLATVFGALLLGVVLRDEDLISDSEARREKTGAMASFVEAMASA